MHILLSLIEFAALLCWLMWMLYTSENALEIDNPPDNSEETP